MELHELLALLPLPLLLQLEELALLLLLLYLEEVDLMLLLLLMETRRLGMGMHARRRRPIVAILRWEVSLCGCASQMLAVKLLLLGRRLVL